MDQSNGSDEGDVFSLVRKAKEGDSEALRELLDHPVVKGRALRICQRMFRKNPKSGYYRDADDLMQDLFFSFWNNLEKFRCEHGEASFWSFIERIAHNIHVTHLRQLTREMEQSEERELDEWKVPSQEDQHLLLSITEVMDSLDERERLILEHRLNGVTLEDIPKEANLDITKLTVHRILENIQKKFLEGVEGSTDKKIAKQNQIKKQNRKKAGQDQVEPEQTRKESE